MKWVAWSRLALIAAAVLCVQSSVPAVAETASQRSNFSGLQSALLTHRRNGEIDAAITVSQTIVARAKAAFGDAHPLVAQALNNLALMQDRAGAYDAAESTYGQALAILGKRLGKSHPTTALVLNNLAATQLAQCKLHEARRSYLRAANVLTLRLGTGHRDARMALGNFRRLSRALGMVDPEEARANSYASPGGFQLRPTPRRDHAQIPPRCLS